MLVLSERCKQVAVLGIPSGDSAVTSNFDGKTTKGKEAPRYKRSPWPPVHCRIRRPRSGVTWQNACLRGIYLKAYAISG